eukprot:snap_masked-scaffold_11-processed-gene-5.45-mRNA-1 protein AED:1.00 eAED:1.00 QI:0/0/0/0/1/1/2/0/749
MHNVLSYRPLEPFKSLPVIRDEKVEFDLFDQTAVGNSAQLAGTLREQLLEKTKKTKNVKKSKIKIPAPETKTSSSFETTVKANFTDLTSTTERKRPYLKSGMGIMDPSLFDLPNQSNSSMLINNAEVSPLYELRDSETKWLKELNESEMCKEYKLSEKFLSILLTFLENATKTEIPITQQTAIHLLRVESAESSKVIDEFLIFNKIKGAVLKDQGIIKKVRDKLQQIAEKVYELWIKIRQEINKPLLRIYWPKTLANDQNPELVFRVREKERYRLRKKKNNDQEQYFKLVQHKKDLQVTGQIITLMRKREILKHLINKFKLRMLSYDPQTFANFKKQIQTIFANEPGLFNVERSLLSSQAINKMLTFKPPEEHPPYPQFSVSNQFQISDAYSQDSSQIQTSNFTDQRFTKTKSKQLKLKSSKKQSSIKGRRFDLHEQKRYRGARKRAVSVKRAEEISSNLVGSIKAATPKRRKQSVHNTRHSMGFFSQAGSSVQGSASGKMRPEEMYKPQRKQTALTDFRKKILGIKDQDISQLESSVFSERAPPRFLLDLLKIHEVELVETRKQRRLRKQQHWINELGLEEKNFDVRCNRKLYKVKLVRRIGRLGRVRFDRVVVHDHPDSEEGSDSDRYLGDDSESDVSDASVLSALSNEYYEDIFLGTRLSEKAKQETGHSQVVELTELQKNKVRAVFAADDSEEEDIEFCEGNSQDRARKTAFQIELERAGLEVDLEALQDDVLGTSRIPKYSIPL